MNDLAIFAVLLCASFAGAARQNATSRHLRAGALGSNPALFFPDVLGLLSEEPYLEGLPPPSEIPKQPRICEAGGGGSFVPIFSHEGRWQGHSRAIFYTCLLLWTFLGVGIISDIFMSSIEVITSTKVRVAIGDGKFRTAKVWNATVANLTLMALGSSAPEIMLSVIELFSRRFYSGELGPSTIVGSAAYNLLVIVAVSIYAIPDGEVRKIKDLGVYAVTASSSIFAYLWILFILVINTKNVVEIWEGVVTFLFFPILVCAAYMADRGYFSSRSNSDATGHIVTADLKPEEVGMLVQAMKENHGNLSPEQIAHLAHSNANLSSHGVKGQHRRSAVSFLKGGARASLVEACDVVVGFKSPVVAALLGDSNVSVTVCRSSSKGKVSAAFAILDGTAKKGEHFHPLDGSLTFDEGEKEKAIVLQLISGSFATGSKTFALELVSAERVGLSTKGVRACDISADSSVCSVTILDGSQAGVLRFRNETLTVPESSENKEVLIKVFRTRGASGKITCDFSAENGSALSGKDYTLEAGTLVFEDQQTEAVIKAVISPKGRYESTENFRVNLSNVSGGAAFDASTDGGADGCVLTVIIAADDSSKMATDRIMTMLANWDQMEETQNKWAEQFREAIYCNGSREGQAEASWLDWVLHIACLPFKVIYACVPPPVLMGGWACFILSLVFVGFTTAIIGDVAAMVGCCWGVEDAITAITFVALGTSLPDTFASKAAAVDDPFADNAIGNVTGSNSVNVFLGLGLPWMIGALYWNSVGATDEWRTRMTRHNPQIVLDYPNGAFVVRSGDLGFSVVSFTAIACIGLFVLALRRYLYDGELGGPRIPKVLSSVLFVGLWIGYLALSICKIKEVL